MRRYGKIPECDRRIDGVGGCYLKGGDRSVDCAPWQDEVRVNRNMGLLVGLRWTDNSGNKYIFMNHTLITP